LVGCNLAEVLQHALGRVPRVFEDLATVVRLSKRTLVYRKDPATQGIHQVLLKASAKVGPDLKACVAGRTSYGPLDCQPGSAISGTRFRVNGFE
jgi:hypothetical protein